MDKIKNHLNKNKVGYIMIAAIVAPLIILVSCGTSLSKVKETEYIITDKIYLEPREEISTEADYDVKLGWYAKTKTVQKGEEFFFKLKRKDNKAVFNRIDDIKVNKEVYEEYETGDIYIVEGGGH